MNMKSIQRSALLPFSAQQMFDLVNDVNRYPEFLPWCGGSEVVSQGADFMEASVTIAKMGIHQTFTTYNQLISGESIHMELKDGPFKSLNGCWHFKSLSDEACKISFEVSFEMKAGVLSKVLAPVFEQIASTMVDSFCKRAKEVY
jgi:ribosome-associated toxin RatA of RatAB toxin-antitoxin module